MSLNPSLFGRCIQSTHPLAGFHLFASLALSIRERIPRLERNGQLSRVDDFREVAVDASKTVK